MSDVVYTVGFPFGGLGAGARGYLDARVELLGKRVRYRSVGGIDLDPNACKDFVYLTDSPSLCADVAELTVPQLRAAWGELAPDVVFLSPPCKGSSKLLSAEKSRDPKYEAMNRLAEVWIELMLAAWATPPRLVLFENVPHITTRAKPMLKRIRARLRKAGYVLHDGFHECGEIGGLAQRRKRFLLVARHQPTVPALLLAPPKKRLRACGEVLGLLPLPGDAAAGPLHRLPAISWLNWVRLALIPAGGDWRDLPGVVPEGKQRRSVFKRHAVEAWTEPTDTVAGSGSNAVANVADPRADEAAQMDWFRGAMGVRAWDDPSGTVTGRAGVSTGRFSVADPRIVPQAGNGNLHWGKYVVVPWSEPAKAVTGAARVGSGALSVADPRVVVVPAKPPFDKAYGVLDWAKDPAHTIAGGSAVGQGAYAVGDPRLDCTPRAGAYGVLSWEEAAKTVTAAACIDNGSFAIADPRLPPDAPPLRVVRSVREKMREPPPVIVAEDGTWHRPMTTLELAALQGLPTTWKGKPLVLAGKSAGDHRERIGNAVPVGAAQAIAEQMLITLAHADAGVFALSSGGAVWVSPTREVRAGDIVIEGAVACPAE